MVNHPNRAKRSSKFPLEWHRNCLTNSRAFLANRQAELERLQNDVQHHQAQIEFYAVQIAEAERRGMDSFDSDRLLINKRA